MTAACSDFIDAKVSTMDAMDILGALLGKKTGSGSPGGKILKDMMSGGRPKSKTQSREHPRARRPRTIGDAARSLEDLLNVSNDHHHGKRQSPSPQTRPSPRGGPNVEREAMNDQAKVLARAMINAAKSDGQMTRDEQKKILERLDSQEEVDFLRAEFDRPLDVREFTWSVPRGMEEQVYVMSLLTIELDEQKEAEYLADLAHGLRLDTSRCNEIHRELGAPVIFKS